MVREYYVYALMQRDIIMAEKQMNLGNPITVNFCVNVRLLHKNVLNRYLLIIHVKKVYFSICLSISSCQISGGVSICTLLFRLTGLIIK